VKCFWIKFYLAIRALVSLEFSNFAVLMPRPHFSISLFFLLFLYPGIFSWAQVFTYSESDTLASNGTWKKFPLEVEYVHSPLNPNFGVEKVGFRIQHHQMNEMRIRLRSPWGQVVNLVDRLSAEGPHFWNTEIGGYQNPAMNFYQPPFTGLFRSFENLGHFNNGKDPNGDWVLEVLDVFPETNTGYLESWWIKFSDQPARLFPFHSSNLPIISISTGGQTIQDEEKTSAWAQILNRTDGMENDVGDTLIMPKFRLGIEYRGSSSQFFPKKSFGIEIRDRLGEDSAASLLDMPAESDWALIANFADKSFMRNAFTYEMARAMGHYSPKTRYVELILNGDYQGLYVLTEKIKQGGNRLNIAKLKPTDTTGNSLTGGYIIKIDKETSSLSEGFYSDYLPNSNESGQLIRFLIDYPKAENLHPKQKAYIRDYFQRFEEALIDSNFKDPNVGYRKYLDINSFVDYFILNEWSRNVDAYRISTYLHKPKINPGNGKLKAGPVWDYDIAWFNADFCGGNEAEGWAYNFPTICPGDMAQPPFWWPRFAEDPEFMKEVACRWKDLNSTVFSPITRNIWMDSVANLISEAQARNFQLWPILGEYIWPNPQPIPGTFEDEVLRLKSWIYVRKFWLDQQLNPLCILTGDLAQQSASFRVYPNPTKGKIRITGIEAGQKISLRNAMGKAVKDFVAGEESYSIGDLPKGIYFLTIVGRGVYSQKIQVE
jgi:subtilisin-like proprotein convertase family protein